MKTLDAIQKQQEVLKDESFNESQIVFEGLPLDEISPEIVFGEFFSHESYTFWLDSALIKDKHCRFSYMGSLSSLG